MVEFSRHRFSLCLLLVLLWMLPSSVWALQHPFFSKNKAAEQKLEALLKAARIQALEYQPAGLSIDLKKLDGSKMSLETMRGKVMLLTRWATWCGACRSELPSKALLQQQFKHPRFAVVGISTESVDTVKKYQSSAKHKYAISLIDSAQVMQRFFPGGGIPVTVLVDGWGWVLGIRKGAGPWHTQPVKALLKYLLSVAPSLKSLQEKVPAPQVHFPRSLKAQVGQVVELPLKLNWNGEQDKYPRIGFRLPRLKNLSQAGVRTSGIQADKDGNQRQYILRLKATKPGTYQLAPLLMNFWLKDNDNHYQKKIGALTLVVAGSTIAANKPRRSNLLAILGLLGTLILIGVFALLAKGQKKKEIEGPVLYDEDQNKRQATLERLLHDSLLRLDNYAQEADPIAFVEEVYWIRTEILDEEVPALEKLSEDIRYGGEELPEGKGPELLKALVADLEADFPEQANEVRDIATRSAFS